MCFCAKYYIIHVYELRILFKKFFLPRTIRACFVSWFYKSPRFCYFVVGFRGVFEKKSEGLGSRLVKWTLRYIWDMYRILVDTCVYLVDMFGVHSAHALVLCPVYDVITEEIVKGWPNFHITFPNLNNDRPLHLSVIRRCFNVVFWLKKDRDVKNVISTSYQRGFTNVFSTSIN